MRTQAPKGPSAHNSCSLRGGTCPPEPCSDSVRKPGMPYSKHTEGKEGLRRGARKQAAGRGLTPCSLLWPIWRFPSDQQAQGNGQRSVGGLSHPSLGSQELGSCGTLLPLWGPVRGREAGPWQPGLPLLEKHPIWAHKNRLSAGPPRRAPLTVEWGPRAGGSLVTEPQTGSPGAR